MPNKILLISFIIAAIPSLAKVGKNYGFFLASQQEYENRVFGGGGVVLRRYLIVPAMDKKYKDIFKTQDPMALISKFAYMLHRDKGSAIERYISTCDHALDINHLLKALYWFSKKQYSEAILSLEKYTGEEHRFLALLLIADCQYEMLPDKTKYNTILDEYQVALDSTDNPTFKAVIRDRIKYIKYQ